MEVAAGIFLSAACVGYNNTLNTWPRFQGLLYVPLNLAFGAATLGLGVAALDLSREDIGLTGDGGDLGLGLLAGVLLTAPAFALALSRHAGRIADRRVTDLRGPQLAYQVLARVPLGTALTEEVVFRGVLFAMWRAAGLGSVAAALLTAAAFGLWHVAPTVNLVRANAPESSGRAIAFAVASAVAFTTVASIALTWVRLESGGLVAPVTLHAATNSLGTIAAVLAGRRSGRD